MAMDIHAEKILILDYGSQYTQLIARRVREAGVYCEIHSYDCGEDFINAFKPRGIILSGGPQSVTHRETPTISPAVFNLDVPVLGICYGMQAMAAHFGGRVELSDKREYGYARIDIIKENDLFKDIADHVSDAGVSQCDVWMSHGDHVTQAPSGFDIIASTPNAPIAAMAHQSKPYYALQFHPEVTHTLQGKRLIHHFANEICQCKGEWTPSNIIEDAVSHIRDQVGNEHVILGLSGGVDSSVTAALLHKAIGKQLTCVFIDNGFLRQGEWKQVQTTFGEHFGMALIAVDAQKDFLAAIQGISDPEEKRKKIGYTFISHFEKESAKIKDATWLAQGTIYPDVIESASSKTGKAETIKTHHNVGGLPKNMTLKVLEPLRELFKDEVREIGLALGLPHDVVYRHPFPGPGLAIRVLGEVKQTYLDILRKADAIYLDELKKENLYQKVSQAFAVFLPVKSVGVMGDSRKYDYVIALRAVETTDFMTAHWSALPYGFLSRVSNRIINEVDGIARVVYDISGKPPATIEWE